MNDAERLSQDPTFRLIGSEKIWERGAGPDFPVTDVRDGDAGRGGEFRGAGTAEPGADR